MVVIFSHTLSQKIADTQKKNKCIQMFVVKKMVCMMK